MRTLSLTHRSVFVSLAAALAFAAGSGAADAQNRDIQIEWLRNAGATFTGTQADGEAGTSVAGLGDVNDDGFPDFVIGEPSNINAADIKGRAYVIFGGSHLEGSASLSTADVILVGVSGSAPEGDQAGVRVSAAGDFNADGIDDILVSGWRNDVNGSASGQVYVVFGSATLSGTINLASLGTGGVTLNGASSGDLAGASLASAGDVNGDGINDILIGASGSDSGANNGGEAYIVYGSATIANTIELSTISSGGGVALRGIAASDRAGQAVGAAGDVDNDGFADVLVAAEQADPGGKVSAGQTYLVLGGNSLPTTLSLASADLVINGQRSGDRFGAWVSPAGDMNGDGFGDFLASADQYDVTNVAGQSREGVVYLIWGADPPPASVNLASLGANGVRFNGVSILDDTGNAVAGGGDINGDGLNDLLIAAHNADPNGGNSGSVYLIYGDGSLSGTISLSAVDEEGVAIHGIAAADLAGSSVAFVGDVDDDGWEDLLIGARLADPGGNSSAGEAYLLYGSCNMLQMAGPATEGGTLEFRAHGAPSVAYLAMASVGKLDPPALTGKGLFWLEPPVFELFILNFGANGEAALSLPIPVLGAVGLEVHMQVFQQPQGQGCDLSYVSSFFLE